MGDSDSDDEATLQYKIILLGDGTVGKTSIAMRFTNDQFGHQYKQTIGLDFMLKRLELPGKTNVALQIWDIGGQQIGSKMLGNYIFGSHAILICYDITSYQSFQNAEDWLGLVRNVFKEPGAMPYIGLIANKSDMSHLRSVKAEKHASFAETNGMKSFYVSAKTGDGINSTFFKLASDLCGITLTRPEAPALPTLAPGLDLAGQAAVAQQGPGLLAAVQMSLATVSKLLGWGAGAGDRVSQRAGGEQVDVASKVVKAEIVENPGARSRAQGGGAGVARKGNRCTVQ